MGLQHQQSSTTRDCGVPDSCVLSWLVKMIKTSQNPPTTTGTGSPVMVVYFVTPKAPPWRGSDGWWKPPSAFVSRLAVAAWLTPAEPSHPRWCAREKKKLLLFLPYINPIVPLGPSELNQFTSNSCIYSFTAAVPHLHMGTGQNLWHYHIKGGISRWSMDLGLFVGILLDLGQKLVIRYEIIMWYYLLPSYFRIPRSSRGPWRQLSIEASPSNALQSFVSSFHLRVAEAPRSYWRLGHGTGMGITRLYKGYNYSLWMFMGVID